MAKLSITKVNGAAAVRCRLSRNETVIGKEIDFLDSCPTQFFLRPRMEGNKTIIFTGADGVSMSAVLKTKMNKERYFLIIAQLIEMLSSAQQYGFDLNRLVLDPKYMLMNRQSGQIFIPYITVTGCETPNGGIVRCLREVSTLAKFVSDYDFSFADSFMCYVMSMGRFSLVDAEDYIRVNAPGAYNEIVRLPSIPSLKTMENMSHRQPEPSLETFSLFRFIYGKAAEPVWEEEDSDGTDIPSAEDIPESKPTSFAPPEREEPAEEEPQPEPEQEETPANEGEGTIFRRPDSEDVPEEDAKDSTAELNAALILRPAKLVRLSTGETFRINKTVYVIGKESARVDCCVTGNKTVSRIHANIVCKNGVFCIIDQNSTNRTFVNGVNVPANVEYRLRDGDEIRLSNEIFSFHEG